MVAATDMLVFMGYNKDYAFLIDAEGQIDARTENAELEGGCHSLALPKVISERDGLGYLTAQSDIADHAVQYQQGHPRNPDDGCDGCGDLHWMDVGVCHRHKGFGNHRINICVECGNAAVYMRRFAAQDIRMTVHSALGNRLKKLRVKTAKQGDPHQRP